MTISPQRVAPRVVHRASKRTTLPSSTLNLRYRFGSSGPRSPTAGAMFSNFNRALMRDSHHRVAGKIDETSKCYPIVDNGSSNYKSKKKKRQVADQVVANIRAAQRRDVGVLGPKYYHRKADVVTITWGYIPGKWSIEMKCTVTN
jgi:hypothetical protein